MDPRLATALLLITSGGFMDAYPYLAFDHVFTNAQSDNVVLFAVDMASLHGAEALKYPPALLAFFPGVFVGQAVAVRRSFGGVPSNVAVLSIQLVLLSLVALTVTSAPEAAGTFVISFASAMQNTVLKSVDGVSYTSVVTTGNLRSATEGLFMGWSRRD